MIKTSTKKPLIKDRQKDDFSDQSNDEAFLKNLKPELDKLRKDPSNTTIKNILNYSLEK